MLVDVYTDGACSGNPGPGGWGVIMTYGSHRRELSGAETNTTNNRMELYAAIMALEALRRPSTVRVHTDSRYVQLGITEWIEKWKRNGWRTSSRGTVVNQDLWKRLLESCEIHRVSWEWVRGHSGDLMNERADELARAAIANLVGTS